MCTYRSMGAYQIEYGNIRLFLAKSVVYCKFRSFHKFYFRETSTTRSFLKIKPWRNGEITLLFTDINTVNHASVVNF